ncbi:hypothetical protein ACFL3R_01350 [Thermodesulfobacteriota bacterium]
MDYAIFEKQLDSLLAEYKSFQGQSQRKDLSDLPKNDRQSLITRAKAAVYRISGGNSIYSNDIEKIIQVHPNLHRHTSLIMGIAQALRDDIKAGYITTLTEIAHGDIFADFLEMAQHLLESGYKDGAAVIAGSTLESHIRELCNKFKIPIEETDKKGKLRPMKADRLNADLAKIPAYTKLDQKSITAWLDLRNKAAHGHYADYNDEQVTLLITGIREFIARNPA